MDDKNMFSGIPSSEELLKESIDKIIVHASEIQSLMGTCHGLGFYLYDVRIWNDCVNKPELTGQSLTGVPDIAEMFNIKAEYDNNTFDPSVSCNVHGMKLVQLSKKQKPVYRKLGEKE